MKRLAGFTLFEVLLGLLLITLSLFTLQAAEQAALRSSRGIHYFTQASILVDNMSQYLHVHRGDSSAYQSDWRKQISMVLPESAGEVVQNNHHYKIIITWGGVLPKQCAITQTGTKGCLIVQTVLL